MLIVYQVSFNYAEQNILKLINFELQPFQNLAIIGESGCGKSTLLKLIYGLLDPKKGTIFWNNQKITGPKYNLVPGMEFIKYLAQDFDLMPYISVAENIGKHLSNFYPEEKKTRIIELLKVIDMEDFYDTPTKNLSGGQKQRVALAQVLALQPQLLLLDEPFSHIDNFRKHKLRRNLFHYLAKRKITCILATHDSNDVLSFAHKTMIMKNGFITRLENTNKTYLEPNNIYEASLFGDVNYIDSKYFKTSNFNNLYYPHQLKVVEKSLLKVEIINHYFMGKHFLIESKNLDSIIYFEHFEQLEKDTYCFLDTTIYFFLGTISILLPKFRDAFFI
jgi:ABC-type sulfate/molybdate transport systems ATPase subunit